MVDELKEIGEGMQNASEQMRAATAELQRRQSLIDSYREKDYAHERLIGRLYEALKSENFDDAMDLVKAEYDAIHGPDQS